MPRLAPKILADLKRDALLHEGHFVYRSGCHSAALLDRDRLLSDPDAAGHMGYSIAKRFFTVHIETVAAPSIWGAGLVQWVAHFLDPKAKIVYATPVEDGLTIADNLADLIAGRRVLLVDNLIISGETLGRFDAAVEELGGEVIGIGTLWDGADEFIRGHGVVGLLNTLYPAYDERECPICDATGTAPERVNY